jgi:hypothetical protein
VFVGVRDPALATAVANCLIRRDFDGDAFVEPDAPPGPPQTISASDGSVIVLPRSLSYRLPVSEHDTLTWLHLWDAFEGRLACIVLAVKLSRDMLSPVTDRNAPIPPVDELTWMKEYLCRVDRVRIDADARKIAFDTPTDGAGGATERRTAFWVHTTVVAVPDPGFAVAADRVAGIERAMRARLWATIEAHVEVHVCPTRSAEDAARAQEWVHRIATRAGFFEMATAVI